jgi:hypothetical protein
LPTRLTECALLTRASPAPQRRGVAASPLSRHGCVAREDILSNRSRGIVPRRFFSHSAKSEGCFIELQGRWAVKDRPPSVLAPGPALRLHLCRALSSVRVGSILAMRWRRMQPPALPKCCVAEPLFICDRVLSRSHFWIHSVCQNELRENLPVIHSIVENTACRPHDDVIRHSSSRSTPCSSPNDFSTNSTASS